MNFCQDFSRGAMALTTALALLATATTAQAQDRITYKVIG